MDNDLPDSISYKSIDKLSRSLDRCSGRYAFLIGAGTSKEAGIDTSSELIEKWSTQEYQRANPDDSKGDWINMVEEEIPDYQNRYGFWFEKTHTTREERRQFIEELVSDADPTFEHIVLSSLMSDDYVPITLTPNFDDLVYDAFYLYLEKRPFLVDHNAIAPQFKITHDDPMIVKLHGDYLYDNLKNTAQETSELEENIKDVLTSTLNEYGLIVIGYSGLDDSVMDVLNSDQVDIPDYGLYWCTYDRDSLSNDVIELLKEDNTFLVEIDSSMDFFYNIYENLDDLSVPTPVDVRERATRRAENLEDDIVQVGGVEVLGLASEYQRREEYDRAIDLLDKSIEENNADYRIYRLKARNLREQGKFNEAAEVFTEGLAKVEERNQREFEKAHDITKSEAKIMIVNSIGITYSRAGEFEKAIPKFRKVIELDEDDILNFCNLAEALILSGDIEEGLKKMEKSLERAEEPSNIAHCLMLLIIAKIIKGEEYNEDLNKYQRICEETSPNVWEFDEINSYIERSDISEEKTEEIEQVVEIYRENKEEFTQLPAKYKRLYQSQ